MKHGPRPHPRRTQHTQPDEESSTMKRQEVPRLCISCSQPFEDGQQVVWEVGWACCLPCARKRQARGEGWYPGSEVVIAVREEEQR